MCVCKRVCVSVCACVLRVCVCARARVLVRPCVRCLRGNCVCARVVYRQADVGAPGIQIIHGLNDLDKVRPNTQRCIGVILVSVCACGMPSCSAGAEPRACACVRVRVLLDRARRGWVCRKTKPQAYSFAPTLVRLCCPRSAARRETLGFGVGEA